MLPTNLTTNEVKNSSAAEVQFLRVENSGRKLVFAKDGEVPSQPLRLTVQHQEQGNGFKLTRRSVARFDVTIISDVDNVTPITISVYAVAVVPVGALASLTQVTNAVSYLNSFLASTGADTTIKYDGTGHGSSALINGSL